MSPVPIIELQRRLTLVGAIRAGGEKQPRQPGRKLEAYRLTSARRQLIEQAATLYGGDVSPWEGPNGTEWQVYTEAEEMPVLLIPGYSLRQTYELWEGATKRLRTCDGVEDDVSGGPCICNQEGVDLCDLYTRLVVALPELDSVLGWRLISRGANAGHELPTMMRLVESQARGATFVPAKLRLDQRRGVKDGQVVRFVVPTIDLGIGYAQLARGANGSPAGELTAGEDVRGFVPAPPRSPSVEQALSAAAAPTQTSPSGGRSAAPLSPDYEPPANAEPIPVDEGASYSETRQTKYLTEPQATKLNVLVGTLRDAGHITTEDLWLAIYTRLRTGEDVGAGIEALGGRDSDGVLHWAPLRTSLTRPEATQLIDWLQSKERQVLATDGLSEPQSDSSFQPPASVRDQLSEQGLPFGEFPKDY